MDINTLQYVVGEVKADAPATIRFFGSVTEENTSRFNDEFDFLENVIRPSCIRVLINSWKIQCKLPPKTKRFCPLVLK